MAEALAPNNGEVARLFTELADSLEILGENAFKIRAYRNAARTLETLPEPISKVAAEDRLGDIPGFGEAIQAKTADILATGSTKALEDARKKVPGSLLELLALPGIGAKTIHQLFTQLQVDSLESLERAIAEERIRTVSGMGIKTEEKLKEALGRHQNYVKRMLLSEAREHGATLMDALRARPDVVDIALAGSARRGVETVGDLDIVATSDDPSSTMAEFAALPNVTKVLARGDKSTRVLLASGFEADLKLAPPGNFASLLLHFTGSRNHAIRLRALAEDKGLKLNEYGLWRLATGEKLSIRDDEAAIYEALGLPPIPVPLREDRGEIEAAQAGTLPTLVQLSDIKGDMHAHTVASDGKATIDEMCAAAKARGYQYMAITDHSQSLAIANGLTPERLREQIKLVRDATQRLGFPIFAGTECDIKPDGAMDFPDDLLAEMDFVIGSVHSRFRQTREEMTARIVRAVENPHVDLIAHPTGRLLNQREPYTVEIEAVLQAAARTNTAMEINSFPERQDLNDIHARMAKDLGVKIMIDTDAHAPQHYALIEYGLNVAQRAWLEPDDVLNTLSYEDMAAWLRR